MTFGGRSAWDARKWRQSVWTSETQARSQIALVGYEPCFLYSSFSIFPPWEILIWDYTRRGEESAEGEYRRGELAWEVQGLHRDGKSGLGPWRTPSL